MKKQNSLQTYLAGRAKNPPKRPRECQHDENHWCQNCINTGQDVEVTLPDGKISRGTIFTSKTP